MPCFLRSVEGILGFCDLNLIIGWKLLSYPGIIISFLGELATMCDCEVSYYDALCLEFLFETLLSIELGAAFL